MVSSFPLVAVSILNIVFTHEPDAGAACTVQVLEGIHGQQKPFSTSCRNSSLASYIGLKVVYQFTSGRTKGITMESGDDVSHL